MVSGHIKNLVLWVLFAAWKLYLGGTSLFYHSLEMTESLRTATLAGVRLICMTADVLHLYQ